MKLATRSAPSILLLIVGDGDLRPQYESKVHELGLSDNVIFVGNAPDDELPAYYAASDVLVLPSEDMSEGFGLTLLEANASGRPCIGSNTGGIPGVICDGYNGFLVPPKDPETLARRVIDMASNTNARQKMGVNGRKIALSHDWKIAARKTEYVYKAAMAR
jgi:D-inositol-3-phosphate glycosyltransferase